MLLKCGTHKKSFILNATLVSCPFPSSLLGGFAVAPTFYEIHSLKLVVKSCLIALRAAPEQMLIPLNKLPCSLQFVVRTVMVLATTVLIKFFSF